MQINALRYLGFENLTLIDKMTISEYQLRIKAYRLQRLDKEYDMHLQAWLINQAKAQKKKGKRTEAYFKSFKDFFDFEEKENNILNHNVTVKIEHNVKSLLEKANF